MRHIASSRSCTVLVVSGFLSACTAEAPSTSEVSEVRSALDSKSTGAMPCDARAYAVTANTGSVIVYAGSKVDSYQSSLGGYGGTNVGQSGTVRSATSIVVKGGVINGKQVPNSPAHLAVIPVPSGAKKLPLGASTPGNVNINVASDSITLAPGSYVVNNLNVNTPGLINIKPQGQVQIWVTGTLNLGGKENLNGVPSNLTFLVNSTGYVNVNSNGQLFGSIYAPSAVVNLNSIVFGSVVGSSVTLNSGSAVHLDQNSTCACGTVDTDSDGTPDCADGCPLDPNKIDPGVCGCGNDETDSDGDGVPNCRDACPNDPTKTRPGTCGCAGAYAPAGTPCADGICSGVFTCDGAGQCGQPASCSPEPGKCTFKEFDDSIYWICHSSRSWDTAQGLCAAVPGSSLADIDSRVEDVFLKGQIANTAWIGANDKSVTTTWRWTKGTNPDGSVFFSNGANVLGGFSRWASGKPADAAGKCGAILADGTWTDQSCTQTLTTYICEKPGSGIRLDTPPAPGLDCNDPSSFCQPPVSPSPGPCVPKNTMPTTKEEFAAQANACLNSNCKQDGDPDCSKCTGAMSIPPVGSTCSAFAKQKCGVTLADGQPTVNCANDTDCPAGSVCGFNCGICNPTIDKNCTGPCSAQQVCGTPLSSCGQDTDPPPRCDEVDICPDPDATGNSDPTQDPNSNLTPSAFDPNVFGQPPSDPTAYAPDPACADTKCNMGKNNGWCSYAVADTLPEKSISTAKHGQSGSGSMVQFKFDPNLMIDLDATPQALGEAKFDLTALAKFSADVTFNLPDVGSAPMSVLDAEAWIRAEPCRIWTTDSKLEVFGHDFLSNGAPGMLFDTSTNSPISPQLTQMCQDALAAYQNQVDRAKKAMKDAEELIAQYKALKAAGKRFPPNFCQTVAATPPSGFPPGDCATESAETTINRFIGFYEKQIALVKTAQATLVDWQTKVGSLVPAPGGSLSFGGPRHTEEQVLFSATFPIGPIPCNLQVEGSVSYGLGGDLDFVVNPGAILSSGDLEDLVKTSGNVTPSASADVKLFVGTGFDIGVASASAGVEGDLTLGDISAPLLAGAGIQVQVERDTRPLPADLAGLAGPSAEIPTQQFRFFLTYDYGASVKLDQILAGSLAAKVRISFWFFSKTWRKTILDFGDGFSAPTMTLISADGVSTVAATGHAPWGLVQMPVPFVTLVPLDPNTPPPSGGPQVSFDTSKVEKLFYDSLCKCNPIGVECFRTDDCCEPDPNNPTVTCFSDPGNGGKKLCSACRKLGDTCNDFNDCCYPGVTDCKPPVSGGPKLCTVQGS